MDLIFGQYFNWMVASSERREPIVTETVASLWAACKAGEQVQVDSIYGRPKPGYRGVIYTACGCGFPLTRDIGFAITGADGTKYVVDSMSLHVVSCHEEKLDPEERQLLGNIPRSQVIVSPEELQSYLKMDCLPTLAREDINRSLKPIDGRVFRSTYRNKPSAIEHAERAGGVVHEFGVEIQQKDPHTGKVTKWVKTEGFSVWA